MVDERHRIDVFTIRASMKCCATVEIDCQSDMARETQLDGLGLGLGQRPQS